MLMLSQMLHHCLSYHHQHHQNVIANHVSVGIELMSSGLYSATSVNTFNFSSFGDVNTFPLNGSVGLLVTGVNGEGSIFTGGNFELCNYGFLTTGAANKCVFNGVRFEANTVDFQTSATTAGFVVTNCSHLSETYVLGNATGVTLLNNINSSGIFIKNSLQSSVGIKKVPATGIDLDVLGVGKAFRFYAHGKNDNETNIIYGKYGMENTAVAGVQNTAVGTYSQNGLLDGAHNTSVGYLALSENNSGYGNTAIGRTALRFQQGSYNTGIGAYNTAGALIGTGNTSLGAFAYQSNAASGDYNITIGYSAGNLLTTGSRNIIIGSSITDYNITASNQLNIGNIIYGTSIDGNLTTKSTGNIGIGISTPQYKLDIDAQTGSAGNPLRLQGLQQGTSTDSLITSNAGIIKRYGLASNITAGDNNTQVFNASISAASNLSGGGTPFTITVSGAAIGDFVDFSVVSDDNDLTDINIKAWVSNTNTVSYQIENKRGSTINFTNKPIKCRVRR